MWIRIFWCFRFQIRYADLNSCQCHQRQKRMELNYFNHRRKLEYNESTKNHQTSLPIIRMVQVTSPTWPIKRIKINFTHKILLLEKNRPWSTACSHYLVYSVVLDARRLRDLNILTLYSAISQSFSQMQLPKTEIF